MEIQAPTSLAAELKRAALDQTTPILAGNFCVERRLWAVAIP